MILPMRRDWISRYCFQCKEVTRHFYCENCGKHGCKVCQYEIEEEGGYKMMVHQGCL